LDPVVKALWFIEGNSTRDITLDDIAAAAGVSRFHLTRAFGDVLHRPVMRYLRARRLTEAARALAAGAPDILAVALAAGYGSHEAFTRAFRDEFGVTPEQVRSKGSADDLELVEPILMQEVAKTELEAPRFVDGKPMLIAGFGRRFEYGAIDGIPLLWQLLQPHLGHIPNEVVGIAYGVVVNSDDKGFDYAAGAEVADFSGVDDEMMRIRVPAQRYAVFAHRGHITTMRSTMHSIWREWLPASGFQAADAPLIERYGPEFDPRSGNGGLEIWLPVKGVSE
jgi:AraC family transcriptional regulator